MIAIVGNSITITQKIVFLKQTELQPPRLAIGKLMAKGRKSLNKSLFIHPFIHSIIHPISKCKLLTQQALVINDQ